MTATVSLEIQLKKRQLLAATQATQRRLTALEKLKVELEKLLKLPQVNYSKISLQKLAKLSGNCLSWFYQQPFIDKEVFRENRFDASLCVALLQCLNSEISATKTLLKEHKQNKNIYDINR